MQKNIPLFIAFRVLFNARFYYPVLGVLFLDLGLTLEQYALLNVVWAVTIICFEIPSGAMADAIGRRKMVVVAAALMVCEMAVFAFAPPGNTPLLFWLLVFNRILSGMAEACASGADEALAYDSLPSVEREQRWPGVLASLMRWQSGAFFVVMLTGAALFDRSLVSGVFGLFGWETPASTTRWPVFATLATSLVCLGLAILMTEPPAADGRRRAASPREALQNLWKGARFVFGTPRIFLLILAALVCDSFIRLFLTFASNYNRLIQLPEFTFGIVGSVTALMGFAAAPLARRLVGSFSAAGNFGVLVLMVLFGLVGVAMAWPLWGVWVMIPLGLGMSFLGFFLSHYLNAWTGSEFRATVLSFRGVALNIGYGAIGLAFAAGTQHLRDANPGATEDRIFQLSLFWLPPLFLVCMLAVAVVGWLRLFPKNRN